MTDKEARVHVYRNELRDRFAMSAMTGMLSDPDCGLSPDRGARLAYQWADAMLAERERQGSAT